MVRMDKIKNTIYKIYQYEKKNITCGQEMNDISWAPFVWRDRHLKCKKNDNKC